MNLGSTTGQVVIYRKYGISNNNNIITIVAVIAVIVISVITYKSDQRKKKGTCNWIQNEKIFEEKNNKQ